jgi:hypothetical protein
MPFLMLTKNYFSDKVGGGGITVDIGIVHNPMIGAGLIIVVIHLGIEEYLMIGEIIIETIRGVVILGIILTFAMLILIIIGGDMLPLPRVVDVTCRALQRVVDVTCRALQRVVDVTCRALQRVVDVTYMAMKRAIIIDN